MKFITLDIETYHTMDADVLARVRQDAMNKACAKSASKATKLEWDTEAARQARADEAIGRLALDWFYADILCVAWGFGRLSPFVVLKMAVEDFMPKTPPCHEPGEIGGNLQDWAERLDAETDEDTVWVGHNITGFDLPVLWNKFIQYGVTPPKHFPQWRGHGRWSGRVWDTMQRACVSAPYIKLDDLSQAYGLGSAKAHLWNGEPMTGARVGEAFEAGEYQLILDYCAADVEAECAVFQKQTFGGVLVPWEDEGTVAARVAEIRASNMTETMKQLAIYGVLDAAGRIP